MHEAGIAATILEIAEQQARFHNAVAVSRVHVQLGEFTSVVREALLFAWDALRGGTVAADAELEIQTILLGCTCRNCDWTGRPTPDNLILLCPRCGQPLEVLAGREMLVQFIDLVEKGSCNV
jgi:hydrogenase nickel incorporation protein HypA/HybF